ncbi:MAG: polyamine ABC transporter ATP-binding protein [Rhizobiales bacterium]|nr:polyamine ABC transporter ATP-binding protein [Hyphomicrobiales bacterium]
MSRVTLKSVSKSYGAVTALRALDLEIEEGEFITLLGPSGCGKTTTLRLIAGFIDPTQGQILLGDDDVTDLPPQRREIGMVFQDYALFPHLTIAENIAFPLRERRTPRERIEPRVRELLELVRLPGVENRYPSELSGGQAQRIAVARAVAYPPRVLLMDEPLGALDLKLRETMQFELRRIQKELQITTVFVTHDQTEAMSMSDRIAVMNEGLLEQLGTAEEIYNRPKSTFVAGFVGRINLLEGTLTENHAGIATVRLEDGTTVRAKAGDRRVGERVSVGVRPEHIAALPEGSGGGGGSRMQGTVIASTFSGNLLDLLIDVGRGKPILTETRPEEVTVRVGDKVVLAWRPEDALVLETR